MMNNNTKDIAMCEYEWSRELLECAKHAYYAYKHHGNIQLYNKNIQNEFFKPFHSSVYKKIHSAQVKKALLTRLHRGQQETLLEKISHAICNCYIEEKTEMAMVVITRHHLKKLKVSGEDFLKKVEEYGQVMRDIIVMNASHVKRRGMIHSITLSMTLAN